MSLYTRAVVDKNIDEELWLAERRKGVTATEVAKLAKGQPAARRDVLAEKVSGERTFFGNKFTDWGLERELALASQPAPGAIELVRELRGRGCRLGILTRNAHELALLTLRAIGLDDCFAVPDVIGRDEAPPKPDPGGLLHFARTWQVAPSELVMVGDYRFDLECARAAGARSVLVNLAENPWPELADHFAVDCRALQQAI